MRSRPIIAFYFAIGILVVLSIAVAYKLVFQPLCTPTKDIPCPVTDAGSIAGIAGTVMGVAATVLALLGAFAVAAWWSQLDDRVNDRVNDLLQVQSAKFDQQVKALESTIAEANDHLQQFAQVQDTTIQNMKDVGKALLYLSVSTRLWDQKKIASAVAECLKAKQLRPDDAQVNYTLGEFYRKLGSYDEAIDCLEKAIATETEFALAHFELGMAYRSRADKLYADPSLKQQHDQEYDWAIEHLEEATRLHPDDEEIIATLGGTYRRYGKYQEALNWYNKALDLNPISSYALGNVASLSWHEGKLDASRKAYRSTAELATKRINSNISYEPFWDYYDRAMAKLVLGPKDDALKDYQIAVGLTFVPENFQSVLSGLFFLKEVEDKYPIDGLNEALVIVEAGKAQAEINIAEQTNP
jgi:tetratricopeptide (TPR) repeat protein